MVLHELYSRSQFLIDENTNILFVNNEYFSDAALFMLLPNIFKKPSRKRNSKRGLITGTNSVAEIRDAFILHVDVS